MTRLAEVPSATQMVKDAQEQARDIKKAQFAGASDILIFSNNTGFGSITIPAYGTGRWSVVFTATRQDNALVDLAYEIFTDGTAEANKDLTMFAEIYRGIDPDPKKTVWRFDMYNRYDIQRTFYVRFYYQATDTGVLSAS